MLPASAGLCPRSESESDGGSWQTIASVLGLGACELLHMPFKSSLLPTVLLLPQAQILPVFKAGLSGGSFCMLGAPGSSLSVRMLMFVVSLHLWVADPKIVSSLLLPVFWLLCTFSSSVQEMDSRSASSCSFDVTMEKVSSGSSYPIVLIPHQAQLHLFCFN